MLLYKYAATVEIMYHSLKNSRKNVNTFTARIGCYIYWTGFNNIRALKEKDLAHHP
jgi:hypothetical protein